MFTNKTKKRNKPKKRLDQNSERTKQQKSRSVFKGKKSTKKTARGHKNKRETKIQE